MKENIQNPFIIRTIPVYGKQESNAYNGHYESNCYHPLLLFNRDGDCLAGKLRPGNVHSADGWNLGNLWRRLALPTKIANWSLTSLQQRLVKTGGRLVKHTRYRWLLLAESHLTRRLFVSTLRRIEALPLPTG